MIEVTGGGMEVGLWTRLGITAVVSLAAGAGLWAVLADAGTDPGISSGGAGALAAVVVTLGSVWASRAHDSTAPGSEGGTLVSNSPQGQAVNQPYGPVFGPSSDFAGATFTFHAPPGRAPETKPSVLGQLIDEKLDPFDLEVHRAIRDENTAFALTLPTYIEREHDRHLQHIVDQTRTQSTLAVLVGGSSTGKTRSCYEAVQRLQGWRLWHPVNPSRPEALLDALDRNIIPPQNVLWLNEMQSYLNDPALGERIAAGLRELLRSRIHGPVLVLGTLWPEYWDTLTRPPRIGEADSHALCRELISGGRKIQVPDTFEEVSIKELPDAARADERIMQALNRPDKRVAQFLAGSFKLLSVYESASAAPHALIDVAIDASRFGSGHTLPQALLREAAPGYLTDYERDELDLDWLEKALEYTGRPCLGIRGPLAKIRSGPSSKAHQDKSLYRLADFLEDTGRSSRRFVMPPETFWDAIANRADSPADLLSIAYEINYRGRYRKAAQIYLMAADAGAIEALLFLADGRSRVGEKADAEAVLRLAAGRGSLLAHVGIAELRHEEGGTESAKLIFRDVLIDKAIDSDDRSYAWRRLAEVCEDSGDIRTARRWLKEAATRGDNSAVEVLARLDWHHKHPESVKELVSSATRVLQAHRKVQRIHREMLRKSSVDVVGFDWAKRYWEDRAAGESTASEQVDALVMLGRLHAAHGDSDTAEAIFLRAINALEEDYIKGVIPALVELMKLLKKKGDTRASERLWKYGLELDGSIADPWKAIDQFPRASR